MLLSTLELSRLIADHAATMGATKTFGETITIRRGSTTLATQQVRLANKSGVSRVAVNAAAEQHEFDVLVYGSPTLDIQESDRFNDSNGTLFEITFVRPNRQLFTAGLAKAVQ